MNQIIIVFCMIDAHISPPWQENYQIHHKFKSFFKFVMNLIDFFDFFVEIYTKFSNWSKHYKSNVIITSIFLIQDYSNFVHNLPKLEFDTTCTNQESTFLSFLLFSFCYFLEFIFPTLLFFEIRFNFVQFHSLPTHTRPNPCHSLLVVIPLF